MHNFTFRVHNAPRLLLAALALASMALPFLSLAPNRLLSGIGHPAPDARLAVPAILLAVLAFARLTRPRHAMALALACFGLVLLWGEAGEGARILADHAPPAARIGLAAGFWTLLFAYALTAVDAMQRLEVGPRLILAVTAALAAAFAVMAEAGQFAHLSLAQESTTHHAEFAAAITRHLVLVSATIAFSLGIGVPLGLAIQRRASWRRPVFATLNIVQTLPSVALFGLLIAPLAALGASGIGILPALIALTLYAMLPVVRQVVAGLDGVDPAVLDAAAGMGLTQTQILTQIALPLAAPALLAGLRIVTVQTIGLAVVAALIGAGGLGDFVFQGLGQYAVDLVLLGALPAIALALLADLLLRLAAAQYRTRTA